MYVIVGLGNPGRQYEGTRHNVGFDVIDMLADENGIELKKLKHKSLVGEGRIAGQKVLLVKPQTYMNLSGEALLDIYNYYKISPEELIVIYDDIDTDLGKLRIRKKGSAGTHNGMKSIIYNLQLDTFPRVRIGVGRPGKGRDLASFVLSRFEKDDMDNVKNVLKCAMQSVEVIIKEGADAAMNKFNS